MIIENVIGFGYNTENWEGCRGEAPVPVESTLQDCRLRPVYHTVTCTFALPVSTAQTATISTILMRKLTQCRFLLLEKKPFFALRCDNNQDCLCSTAPEFWCSVKAPLA